MRKIINKWKLFKIDVFIRRFMCSIKKSKMCMKKLFKCRRFWDRSLMYGEDGMELERVDIFVVVVDEIE